MGRRSPKVAKPGRFEAFVLDGWRPYLWVVLAAVLVHLPALGFEFSGLDDTLFFHGNREFLSDLSNAPRAFGRTLFDIPGQIEEHQFYRPLFTISFMVDMQRGGAEPSVFHFTNVLLHAVASALLFLFFTRLGHGRALSLAASILFAVHPLASSTVAWIPGRNDTLLAVFVLAAFLSYLAFLRTQRLGAAVLHVAAFACALFTKESAALFLPLLLFYRFVVFARTSEANAPTRPSGREWGLFAAWIVIVGGWWMLRADVVDRLGLGFMIRSVIRNLPAFVPLVGKVVIPIDLSTYPTLRDSPVVPGIWTIVLLGAAALVSERRRLGAIVFGAGWLVLFLAPTFVFLDRPGDRLFYEHRMYVPMIGVFLILLEARPLRRLAERPARFLAAAAVPSVLFAGLTVLHDRDFSNPFRVWENAVRTSPHCVQAHLTLGARYGEARRFDEAEREFRTAYDLDPNYPAVHFNLGVLYRDRKEYAKAEEMFREELALHPDHAGAYFFLGFAAQQEGNEDEAIRLWKKCIELDPNYRRAYDLLVITYCKRQEIEEARRWVAALESRGGRLSPSVQRAIAPYLERRR